MTRSLRDMTDAELYELRRKRQEELFPQGAAPQAADEGGGDAPNRYARDGFGAFAANALDSLSFGWGDEALGALRGVGAALTGGNFGDTYDQHMRESAEDMRQHRFWNPEASLIGSLAGGIGAGGGLGLLAKGTGLLNALRNLTPMQRIAAAAGGGAASGAAYGAGAQDYDRLGGALNGGLWGGVLGGGLQAAGMGAAHTLRSLTRETVPEQRAASELGKSLERLGLTRQNIGDNLARHRQMAAVTGAQPTMMDVLGDVGTDLTQAAGQRPSAGRVQMYQTMNERNKGMRERADDLMWKNLGGGGRVNPASTVEGLEKLQKTEAAPLYAKVYQEVSIPAVPRPLRDIEARNPLLFSAARTRAEASARRVLGADASKAEIERSSLFWHRFLENVQSEVGAHIQQAKLNPLGAARGSQIAEMTQDSAAFNTMIRRLLGADFRKAQDIYSSAARNMDALEFGADAVRATSDLQRGQLARRLNRMSAGEREHAKLGALSALSEALERDPGNGRANVLRGIIGSQQKRRTLEFLFGGSDKFDEVLKGLDFEQELFENTTKSGIRSGPNTAEKLQGGQSVFGPNEIGGFSGMMRRFLGREMKDRSDEKLADSILDLMRTPALSSEADDLLAEANKRGLLSRALRDAEKRRNFRAQMGPRALLGGITGSIGFAPDAA